MGRWRRVAAVCGALAISAVAVVLLARSVDLAGSAQVLSKVNLGVVALALFGVAGQFTLRSVRWKGLVEAMAGTSPSLRAVAGSMAVGYLGNAVLPARLGEPARVIDLSRRAGLAIDTVTASVVLERAIDVLALGTFAAAGVLAAGAPSATPLLIVASLGALALLRAGGAWLARRPGGYRSRPVAAAARFGALFASASAPVIARAFVLSLLAWFGDAFLFWVCAQGLEHQLDLVSAIAIAVAADLATVIPSAGGYVGTYELGVMSAGVALGLSSTQMLPLAVVAHAVAVIPLALLGLGVILARGVTAGRLRRSTEQTVGA